MRRKVALINPRKGWRPPLGLLYVASYLREAKYNVKIYEFIDEKYNALKNIILWKEFMTFNPDFIGLGVISWNRKVAGDIITKIRNIANDKIIVCGGKDPSFVPEKYFNFGADAIVIGEGEETVVELFNAYASNTQLQYINGIAYKDDNKIVKTEPRMPTSLDNLLFPAFEMIDFKQYTNIRLGGIPGHFIKTGFMMANRGCPYKCKFCAETVRNVYRERSIDNIIKEIKWQIKEYNIKGLVLLDDLFYFKEERVAQFCEVLLRENIKLKLLAQTRVDQVGNKETLRLMKKAGFIQLALGVESGSPRVLESIGKGVKVRQIKEAIQKINDAGIESYSYLVVGFPGENEEDLKKTEELLKEVNSTFVAVMYYMPMPGTKFYEKEDDKMLDSISFSHTEYRSFRGSRHQKMLADYRMRFQSISQINPNLNLFRYPGFYVFLAKVLFLHPRVLLKGFYIQRTKNIYSSYFEAVRTAMINYSIYG